MANRVPLKNLLKKLKLNESTISLILGVLVVIVVGGLVINYFKNTNKLSSTTLPSVSENNLANLPTNYTVTSGDSLWKIAEKFYGSGYNWVDIARENDLNNPNVLVENQELVIPKTEVITPAVAEEKIGTSVGEAITIDSYTVVKGDCLWNIAVRAYSDGYQWVKIARENNLVNPNLIHPGNVLIIPR